MSGQLVLEIKDLTCGYPAFMLREINLKIEQGVLMGIIGPNGSGKTSLLRGITGFLEAKSGDVYLEGRSIRHTGRRMVARKLAVVVQNPGISNIVVEDYVLLGRIPHQRKFQFFETPQDMLIAEAAMEMTGILGFRYQYLSQLSGGERQLVWVARALAQQPEILLLDEPTTFLDITHQVRIMDLLKRLNRETGLTVIMVLHDLNLAGEYCNQLVMMKEGRVYRTGSPGEVLTYQTIEEVYKTVVVVGKSPVSSRPYIYLVTEEERRNIRLKKQEGFRDASLFLKK